MLRLIKIIIFIILFSNYGYAAQQTIECIAPCDPLTNRTQRQTDQLVDDNFDETYGHMQDALNPHFVTASQLSLGNVDNTSDADKPVSSDQQVALDAKADALTADENYVTDAQLVVIVNTSGTNSGDQTISDAVYGAGWDADTTSAASKNALYDKIESIVGGITDINDIGDATADGATDFLTRTIKWDINTGAFQIGDGGSNYFQFGPTGVTIAGTYGMTFALTSKWIDFTPLPGEPATIDGRFSNVSGVSGYPDVISLFDGTNVWRYIAVDSDDTVGAGYMIGHDGTNFETVLIQSQLKVNTLGTFTVPITTATYALTAANLYNSTLFYGATGEVDLAAGVDGMATIIYNTGAFTITIDPNGSEVIVRDGTAQTGGVSMTLSSGAGNFVALVFNGTQWVTMGFKGTLAEGT